MERCEPSSQATVGEERLVAGEQNRGLVAMVADVRPDGGRGRVGGERTDAQDLAFVTQFGGGDFGGFEGAFIGAG